MDVTLLGCFSILRFEITDINFCELIQNKNGLGVSCLARYGFYDVDCFWSDSKSD